MVKRLSFKPYLYVAFALIVMIACWESNRAMAAIIVSDIPEEAIRLRILANSDSPEDQLLKRQIRDQIMQEMSGWIVGTNGIAEARNEVNRHLPKLESIVASQLAAYGRSFDFKVELGLVPFPAKLYGNKVYPAGEYEALLITIGSGQGQNWWCVLFPPLCFVDGKVGTAAASKTVHAQQDVTTAAADLEEAENKKNDGSKDVEVKFFVWELVKQVSNTVKGLFA